MMDWDKLRIFHAVASAKSITAAADSLNLSQSAVSRQVSNFEDAIRTPLFHRHARGVSLTAAGENLFNVADEVFTKLALAESMLEDSREKPAGQLVISTSVGFGSMWLSRHIHEFVERYPEIKVELNFLDYEVDLSHREADIAIRMHPPTQADLISRRLMTVHTHIYASQSYLVRNGVPKSLEDLDNHKVLCYGGHTSRTFPTLNWLMEQPMQNGDAREAILQINNVAGLINCVLTGMGLGPVPDFIASMNEGLVRVLPSLELPTYDAYLVYPEELRGAKRIEAFKDFLVRKIAQSRF